MEHQANESPAILCKINTPTRKPQSSHFTHELMVPSWYLALLDDDVVMKVVTRNKTRFELLPSIHSD